MLYRNIVKTDRQTDRQTLSFFVALLRENSTL